MSTFVAGDVVKLMSGGPLMTIESVGPDAYVNNVIVAACVWFVDGETRARNFPTGSLTQIAGDPLKLEAAPVAPAPLATS